MDLFVAARAGFPMRLQAPERGKWLPATHAATAAAAAPSRPVSLAERA